MKRLILLTCVMSLFILGSKAQGLLDSKVNKVKGKLNSANATATGAVSTADSTKKQAVALTNQAGDMLGVKKRSVYVIKVPGATRGKIKEICAAVQNCPGVGEKNADYVWSDTEQSITVKYKDSINKLLDALEKNTPLVTDSNATTSSDGSTITIKL